MPMLASVVLVTAVTLCATKPNIVHILADDLGYGMVGHHNNGTTISPSIDTLYREGLDLRQMQVTTRLSAHSCPPPHAGCSCMVHTR